MSVVDVHQHFWPQRFVEALSRRERPPRLRGSTLELANERETTVDLGAHLLENRLALLDRHGIDVAVVSVQPTLGIDDLEPADRDELVGLYEEGMLALAGVTSRLVPLAAGRGRDGFVGACLNAQEFLDLDRLAPTLDELDRSKSFVFVHPGPARANAAAFPDWWAAVVDYTAQMQAAYASWLATGVERWPELPIVFAMLAGGGPFQLERLQSRGLVVRDLLSMSTFFETSSYGRRALELCLSTFGVSQLLFGSDAPVIDPEPTLAAVRVFGDAVTDALCAQNPARLLR